MLILGLNPGSHDSAACIVSNGIVLAACEEERLTRRKHAMGEMPWHAVLYCLSRAGSTLADVDYVALCWGAEGQPEHTLRLCSSAEVEREIDYYRHRLFPVALFGECPLPQFIHVSHHLSHAASAFRCSPFVESAVLTVDGQGDHVATSIAHGVNGSIAHVASFGIDSSLGYFYQAVTESIGLGTFGQEGQTMALAAYGTPRYSFDELEIHADGYSLRTNDGPGAHPKATRDFWKRRITDMTGEAHNSDFVTLAYSDAGTRARDLAASAQAKLEEVVVHLAKLALQWTGCGNLALAGGVALNCAANGAVARAIAAPMFVFPAAGDAGAAVGAALEVAASMGEQAQQPFPSVYLGPGFSDEDCERTLHRHGIPFQVPNKPLVAAAGLIADGYIVGCFQGRAEFGPRALGNRSILADPRSHAIRDRVNTQVKHRLPWRPFAPSIRAGDAAQILGKDIASPYMLIAAEVPALKQTMLRGIVHVDGTTRPQTVAPEDNPRYHDLIEACGATLGVAAVLNTSFNDAGEPMVCSPEDAIRTFQNAGLDYLLLGPLLVGPKPSRGGS